MSFGTAIEAALGLIFVFVLVSIVASAIQEVFAAVLSSRGKVMVAMLESLLQHDAPPAGAQQPPPQQPAPPDPLAQRVLAHPLIGASATSNLPAWIAGPVNAVRLPSYIPSRNLALALIEELRKDGIDTLPNGAAKRSLDAFIVDAKGDLDAFKQSVQNWYDDAMDRASGVYKRNAQYMLLAIGLVLAVVLNIDTLRIGETLWHDPQARAAVAAAADAYIKSCTDKPATAAGCPTSATPKTPDSTATDSKTPAAAKAADDAATAALLQLRTSTLKVASLPVPMGWADLGPGPDGVLGWLNRLIGWLLTAFAVSLGAPFWFDLLSQVSNLRGAGPRPDRADADD